jgi:hypothetical protein
MASFNIKLPTRTGIQALNSSKNVQKKSTNIKRVANPVLNYQVGSGLRAQQVGTAPPFDIEAVRNAYLVDSYIRQGIDKYIEIIIKEGWKLEGQPAPKAYIEKRLKIMGFASGEPWELILENAIRDFVKYGNCFLVTVRTNSPDPIPGLSLKGYEGKPPVGAYFNLPAHQMAPQLNENGDIAYWIQKVRNVTKTFKPEDILHFTYCKEAGGIWGIPPVVSVIEDIRALRQAEENVLKLIYKHLNPIIHQQVPDITGTGEGRQEDIDDAIRNFQTTAPDGFIITPPGHKIQVVGAESQAIRAEGYLKLFKQRVFSGLGVSELVMGENVGAPAGTADALTTQMHNRAKMYQLLLTHYITMYIFNELLIEGGFDPWNNPEDQVVLGWHEIEVERQIKEQTHALNLWTMNAISSEELRQALGRSDEANWKDYYVHQVQIPQLVASKIGMDPIDLKDGEIKDMVAAPKSSGKVAAKSITKDKKQTKNIISPSNKTTGPLAKAGAPTAQKMSVENYSSNIEAFGNMCETVVSLIPGIKEGTIKASDLRAKAFGNISNDSYILPLCNMIVNDVLSNNETTGYIRVNARLSNERPVLLVLMEGEK